ncbi:MAG: helix-turn-helix domain-containing protein [Fimbriimonas sp.]
MHPNLTTLKLAYTVREAANLLSLSRSLVYELINAGKIDTIKIGRARRITAKQLADYVTAREREVA